MKALTAQVLSRLNTQRSRLNTQDTRHPTRVTMKTKLAIFIALLLMPLASFAQFTTGEDIPPPKPAWQQFKLPHKTVSLDFRNASPDMVLSFFSKASGITIVKDPAINQGLTLQSAKPVSLDEAFTILNTALDLRGYELRKQGNIMIAGTKQDRGNRGGMDMAQMFRGQQSVLKVYPIQFANATAVSRVINDVFSPDQTAAMTGFPFGGGRFGGGRFGGGRFGGGNIAIAGNPGQNGQNQGPQPPQVHASADDYSNSVIVNAPQQQQDQIADLVKQIDKPAQEPFQSKVYKLLYASSDDLAPVVQNVLTANAPQGRGGQTSTNADFGQRFQQALRLGSSQAAFGTVVSEPRTNSLIVTATPENQALVANVVKELDTQIHFADSAVVVPLDNARADQVAYLLNQAFGSRVANTNFANFGRPTTGTNNGTTINTGANPFSGGNNSGRLGGLNQNADPNAGDAKMAQQAKDLQLQLADPTLNAGDLETNIAVAQGGFFNQLFGGGNRNGQQQNQPQVSRDENGRLVNVHNLNGQVTVIPDINTNSVIVVTNPENMAMIKSILDQLDRIPQQVMIETIITEATLDSSSKLGVEWQFVQGKAFGTPGATGVASQNFGLQSSNPTGFKYTLTSGNLTAFVNALKTDSRFQILSTPRIFTSNNVQAQINISQRIPYVVNQTVDVNGNIAYTYNFEDVGIILTVTPRITANGMVTMDVSQTANDLQGFTSFNAPIINQRQASTTVAVKDGETIILGGIIRNTVSVTTNKIPLLGDIPILGQIFRTTSKSNEKTELLVFLTPRVVASESDARRLRQQQQGELSKDAQKSVDTKIKQNQIPPKEGGQ